MAGRNSSPMNELVTQLETLLPDFRAFGKTLETRYENVTTKIFSIPHGEGVHNLGLNCFPRDSTELDERCVALIVTISELSRMAIKGYVSVNMAPFVSEFEKKVFRDPSQQSIRRALREVKTLLVQFDDVVKRTLVA